MRSNIHDEPERIQRAACQHGEGPHELRVFHTRWKTDHLCVNPPRIAGLSAACRPLGRLRLAHLSNIRNLGDALRRQSEETTDVQWRRQLCTVFSSQWTPDYLRFERQQPRPPQPEFRSVSDQPRWNGTAADHFRSGFRWIPDVYE